MRESIDSFYIRMARFISERSTCTRRKVGAIIVRDKMVLGVGYNGVPSKIKHCTKETCIRTRLNIPSGERHELCITGDTIIKLLDGTYKTIKELADNGDDIWLYSINTKTGEIVPGYAINPHFTGIRNDIVEITFDNGKKLRCTSDHKILMRNCEYVEAKDLNYGDSCMPIYYNRGKNNDIHEVVQNIRRGKGNIKWDDSWKCNTHQIKTHEMVYRNVNDFFEPLGKNTKLIHHIDENKFNNTPNNLTLQTSSQHRQVHSKSFIKNNKDKHREISKKGGRAFSDKLKVDDDMKNKFSKIGKENMNNNWKNEEWRKQAIERCRKNLKIGREKSNKDPKAIESRKKGNLLSGLSYLIFKCNENNLSITNENYNELRKKYCPKSKLGEKGPLIPKMDKILNFYNSLDEALQDAKIYNHKVVKVEKIKGEFEVYDLSVPEYGNFAVDLGDNSCVVISNCYGVHSEANAIATAAKNGVNINNSTLYCTTYPCAYCAKIIVSSGISKVVYSEGYPDELSKTIMQNIEVVKYEEEEE